jgi:CcmD family protein
MGTLVAGYLLVWFAVVLYVARLGRRQRQLRASFEDVQAACRWPDDEGESRSRAA